MPSTPRTGGLRGFGGVENEQPSGFDLDQPLCEISSGPRLSATIYNLRLSLCIPLSVCLSRRLCLRASFSLCYPFYLLLSLALAPVLCVSLSVPLWRFVRLSPFSAPCIRVRTYVTQPFQALQLLRTGPRTLGYPARVCIRPRKVAGIVCSVLCVRECLCRSAGYTHNSLLPSRLLGTRGPGKPYFRGRTDFSRPTEISDRRRRNGGTGGCLLPRAAFFFLLLSRWYRNSDF